MPDLVRDPWAPLPAVNPWFIVFYSHVCTNLQLYLWASDVEWETGQANIVEWSAVSLAYMLSAPNNIAE